MTQDEFISQLGLNPNAPMTATDQKISELANKVTQKQASLGLTPTVTQITGEFYDADTTSYNNQRIRVGDQTGASIQAPESPETIQRKFNREATPEEVLAYQNSVFAKDNYIAGLPVTERELQDYQTQAPLDPISWKIYQAEMTKINKEKQLFAKGVEGHTDYQYNRPIKQIYLTPEASGESLQDRLASTGVAEVRQYRSAEEQLQPQQIDTVPRTVREGLGEALQTSSLNLVKNAIGFVDDITSGVIDVGAQKAIDESINEINYQNPESIDKLRKSWESYEKGEEGLGDLVLQGLKTGGYALVESAPYMLATANPYTFAITTASVANDLAEGRAQAEGKEDGADAIDNLKALPFAIVSMALEKLGVERSIIVPFQNAVVAGATKRAANILQGAATEYGTETIQSAIEGTYKTLGTKEWQGLEDTLWDAHWNGIVGGIAGGQAATASTIAGDIRPIAKATNDQINTIRDKYETYKTDEEKKNIQLQVTPDEITTEDINEVDKYINEVYANIKDMTKSQTISISDDIIVLEDVVNKMTDSPQRKEMKKKIDEMKDTWVAKVELIQEIAAKPVKTTEDERILGASKQDIERALQTIQFDMSDAEVDQLAQATGLNRQIAETYKQEQQALNTLRNTVTGKTAAEVEGDVVDGPRGYKTYLRNMKQAVLAGNYEKANEFKERLENFKLSQQDKLPVIDEALKPENIGKKFYYGTATKTADRPSFTVYKDEKAPGKALIEIRSMIEGSVQAIDQILQLNPIPELPVQQQPEVKQEQPVKAKPITKVKINEKVLETKDAEQVQVELSTVSKEVDAGIDAAVSELEALEVTQTRLRKKIKEHIDYERTAKAKLRRLDRLRETNIKLKDQMDDKEISFSKQIIKRMQQIIKSLTDTRAKLQSLIRRLEGKRVFEREKLADVVKRIEVKKKQVKRLQEAKKEIEREQYLEATKQLLDNDNKLLDQIRAPSSKDPVITLDQLFEPNPVKSKLGTVRTFEDIKALGVNRFARNVVKARNCLKKALKTNADRYYVYQQNIGRRLLLDNDGTELELNPMATAALVKVADDWFNAQGLGLRMNSDSDIAAMLGKSEEQVTENEKRVLRTAGGFKKIIANSLGKQVLNELGLRLKSDTPLDIEQALVADLGQLALIYLEQQGYIKSITETKLTKEDQLVLYPDMDAKSARGIAMIQISENGEGFLKQEGYSPSSYIKQLTRLSDVESFRKEEVYKRPVPKEIRTKGGDIFETPAQSQKITNKLRQQAWKINEKAISRLQKMDSTIIAKYLGYKTKAEIKELPFQEQDAQLAKNREIEISVKELYALKDRVKENGNKFYFEYFFGKNGRYYLDSNTINPQTDKLHRFMMGLESNEVTVTSKNRDTFYIAVAQAFGYAIDKKSKVSAIEVGKKIARMSSKEREQLVEKKEFELDNKKIKVEEIGHAIQALTELENYHPTDEFQTSLTLEIDAVTSGIILKMMQMPLNDSIYKLLTKGGIITKEGLEAHGITNVRLYEVEGINELLDQVDDIYKTLARTTNEKMKQTGLEVIKDVKAAKVQFGLKDYETHILRPLSDYLPSFLDDDGYITSAARNLFKPVVMTFGYGAMTKSIIRAFSQNIVDKVVSDAVNGDAKAINVLRIASPDQLGGLSDKRIIRLIKDQNILDLTAIPGTDIDIQTALMNTIKNTYGSLIKESLNDTFPGMEEANGVINQVFKDMFEQWKVKYHASVNKLGGPLTKEKQQMIFEGLRKDFPSLKAPFSSDDSRVMVVDSKKADASVKAQTYVNEKQYGQKSITVQAMLREFEAAMSAGVVLPIHYLDGSIQGMTLLDNKALGIHDAQVYNIDNAVKGNASYNKYTYEFSKSYSMIDELVEASKVLPESKRQALLKLQKQVSINREKLFSKDMIIDHATGLNAKVQQFSTEVDIKSLELGGRFAQGLERMSGEYQGVNDILRIIKDFKDC